MMSASGSRRFGRVARAAVLAVALWTAHPACAASPASANGRGQKPPPAEPVAYVRRIRVEGVSVLPQAELQAMVAPYEGKDLSLSNLRLMAAAIERRYHNRGYFLAKVIVPEQKVADFEIRLLALEGRVGEVRTEGNVHFTHAFLRRHFAPVLAEPALRQETLRRCMLILNEFPDLRVQSVLEPGKQEGTVDVILKVTEDRPLHLTLEYNNFGNRFVGRNRAVAAVSAGNLLRQGDGFTGRVTHPFPSESDPFLQFDYSLPVNDRGRRFGLQYASAATTPGAELAVLDIRGDADIFGFNLQFPLKRTISTRSTLVAAFVAKSVDNFILGAVPLSNDEIRAVSANYLWSFSGEQHRAVFSSTLTQGLGSAFGGTPSGSPVASRVGASDNFTRINVDMARIQKLGGSWSLIVRGTGQITGTPLLVPEQFALGGPDSVRGYLQSEVLGDDGYTVSVDFRYDLYSRAPNLVQATLFYDHGGVSLENPQVGEVASRAFTAAGAGLRANLFDNSTTLRADLGLPLSPDRNADGDDYTLHVSVSVRI